MGSVVSSGSTRAGGSGYVTSESETMEGTNANEVDEENTEEEFHDTLENNLMAKSKEDEMNEFRKQLDVKREQRRQILVRHRTEKEELMKSLEIERRAKLETYENNRRLRELLIQNDIEIPEDLQAAKENSDLADAIFNMKEEFEKLKSNNTQLRKDLVESNSALQSAYSDIADLNGQNIESMKQINALKEVVSVSKTMINLREHQLTELKNKLNEIEKSLAERETQLLSVDLRQEYVRQLQNIRTLRSLYEERARLAEVTRQSLVRDLDEHKRLYNAEVAKCKDLTEKVETLEETVSNLEETVDSQKHQLYTLQDETRGLQSEMMAVNKLFSQVLLGYKTKQDLDKLIHRLEEHQGLLIQMAERENGSEISSALPKLLLEIVSQVDDKECKEEFDNVDDETKATSAFGNTSVETESQNGHNSTAEEIVQKLPKVWKVLIQLLSHQTVEDTDTSEKVTTCYKSIETKSGPVLVPSVSQTYIRLKDLIIEKLALIKEVNQMKQLNSHLETRLEEQEKKLCLVSSELSKTWHVVGRLRRHHHQLHTHENILKYELQQKRKLLNELKEELEYCREKWEQAREKNSQSEKDWRKLRAEFSSRKTKTTANSFNTSAESGYSDERASDESSESNDESEYVTEPLVRSKKKLKKAAETVLDSSADFNLAAEREDPASDMLDVADLPLDTQEGDVSPEPCASETGDNICNHTKMCEETEDEFGDIAIDSCVEESSIAENNHDSNNAIPVTEHNATNNDLINDPSAILKMDMIEKNTALLLSKTIGTGKLSEQINNTLDDPMNRPTCNTQNYVNNSEQHTSTININTERESCVQKEPELTACNDERYKYEYNSEPSCSSHTTSSTVDFKAILENIKKQDERLTKKDEKLERLEQGCADVVNSITNTISFGEELVSKMNSLHDSLDNHHNTEIKCDATVNEAMEPSTSVDLDHEARFAARDLRLKRLEEQTKSLVTKMNKTKTKGVKIDFKLQELHNIYGSENSRASTPEETSSSDDKSHNDDEASTD